MSKVRMSTFKGNRRKYYKPTKKKKEIRRSRSPSF